MLKYMGNLYLLETRSTFINHMYSHVFHNNIRFTISGNSSLKSFWNKYNV